LPLSPPVGDDRLSNTYRQIAGFAGPETAIESLRSVETVIAHRSYWRPEVVRVVLLAESHLHTPDNELESIVDLSRFGHSGTPRSYSRFVYCLGYGEDEIIDGRVERNRGTPQFWKLFHACVHGPDGNVSVEGVQKGGTPHAGTRIRNKIAILEAMKRRGIWLVDSSLVGVYIPGGEKHAPEEIRKSILASWEGYWFEELSKANPAHIVCIGLGVQRTLQAQLDSHFAGRFSAIEQPNARLAAERHRDNLIHCAEVCRRFAPA